MSSWTRTGLLGLQAPSRSPSGATVASEGHKAPQLLQKESLQGRQATLCSICPSYTQSILLSDSLYRVTIWQQDPRPPFVFVCQLHLLLWHDTTLISEPHRLFNFNTAARIRPGEAPESSVLILKHTTCWRCSASDLWPLTSELQANVSAGINNTHIRTLWVFSHCLNQSCSASSIHHQ